MLARRVLNASTGARPADLIATALHLMGVSPALEVQDRTGRPMAACAGKVVAGVIG